MTFHRIVNKSKGQTTPVICPDIQFNYFEKLYLSEKSKVAK